MKGVQALDLGSVAFLV